MEPVYQTVLESSTSVKEPSNAGGLTSRIKELTKGAMLIGPSLPIALQKRKRIKLSTTVTSPKTPLNHQLKSSHN
tara:strand:- start:903 stop:1127 length:225 start_codon:yes stop_codon:yes gene_type:complete